MSPDREILKRLALCGATIILLAAPYLPVGGLPFWPLAFFALVPFAALVERTPARSVLALSYATGVGFFLLGMYWLAWATVAGYIALCLYLGAYFVLLAVQVRALRRLRLPMAVALPMAWVTAELLRARLFTGLPWLQLGHTQQHWLALIQFADAAGVYGVSFLVAAANGAIFDIVHSYGLLRSDMRGSRFRGLVSGGCVAVAFLAALGYGAGRLNSAVLTPGPRIALVQANIPLDLKHSLSSTAWRQSFFKYLSLSVDTINAGAEGGPPDIIIWPETVVSGNICDPEDQWGREVRQSLADLSRRGNCILLVGVSQRSLGPEGAVVYNSAVAVGKSPRPEDLKRYDKMHLVPFGEYVPLGPLLSFLNTVVPYDVPFSPGKEATIFQACGARFGVLICFEDVFPRLAGGEFCRAGAADFLVSITNDGWFGESFELDQHLAISRFRAIENRVGVVRATNTGISAFIDPTGRVQSVLERNGRCKQVSGALTDRVMLDVRRTFYTRHGDVFAWSIAAVGGLCWAVEMCVRWRRRKIDR